MLARNISILVFSISLSFARPLWGTDPDASTIDYPNPAATTIEHVSGRKSECTTAILSDGASPQSQLRDTFAYLRQMEKLLQAKYPGASMSRLTEGGESFVYLIEDKGRRLAVKFPRFQHRYPLQAYTNEYASYLTMSTSDKRWFVPLLEFDETGPFLVMKFIGDGKTLLDHLSDYGPEAEPLFILQTMLRVATAAKSLHVRQVAHADLKPENILIEPDEKGLPLRVYITDLTMVTPFGRRTPYVGEGKIVGTPQYMPQKARSGDPVVEAAWDLNALMITFQAMIMGELPFLGADPDLLSHELALGRSVKFLVKSPYSILKSSGLSPILSAISYVRFSSIDLLIRAIKEAMKAYRANDPDLFFRDFYGPFVLAKQSVERAAHLIAESDELKERLGTSVSDCRLGLSKTKFSVIYRAYKRLIHES